MKTSEFGKKMGEEGFTVYRSETDITFSKDGLIINIGLLYENPSVAFNFTNFGHNSLTAKQWSLINSYLQTKPENRKKKRKWVITWGTDEDGSTPNFWKKGDAFKVGWTRESNWKKNKSHQFTDSELEQLKSTQSPAIAKAIDIAKELVSDEA